MAEHTITESEHARLAEDIKTQGIGAVYRQLGITVVPDPPPPLPKEPGIYRDKDGELWRHRNEAGLNDWCYLDVHGPLIGGGRALRPQDYAPFTRLYTARERDEQDLDQHLKIHHAEAQAETHTYEVTMPNSLSAEAIEDLRGLGAIRLVYTVEFPSRAEAVNTLGDEYGWRGFDRTWWHEHLSGRRTRRGN